MCYTEAVMQKPIVSALASLLILYIAAPQARGDCKRALSVELKASVARPTTRDRGGTCAAATGEEKERQLTQAKLECLMNGFEDATDLKVDCRQLVAHGDAAKSLKLQFNSTWRCSKMICDAAKR